MTEAGLVVVLTVLDLFVGVLGFACEAIGSARSCREGLQTMKPRSIVLRDLKEVKLTPTERHFD